MGHAEHTEELEAPAASEQSTAAVTRSVARRVVRMGHLMFSGHGWVEGWKGGEIKPLRVLHLGSLLYPKSLINSTRIF